MLKELKKDNLGCLIAPSVTGEQIRNYRLELGMTQAQFSKEFRIPLGTLRRWEQGQNIPRSLTGLIRAFGEILARYRTKEATQT